MFSGHATEFYIIYIFLENNTKHVVSNLAGNLTRTLFLVKEWSRKIKDLVIVLYYFNIICKFTTLIIIFKTITIKVNWSK